MDHWYEEDEEIVVHPRDPYHRVDVVRSDRHVTVSLNGELLAESTSPTALFESNLPPRWYLPAEDIRAELEPSDTITRCPYKGTASYYSVKLDSGEVVKDLVWYYAEPIVEATRIKGLLCFFSERVDLELDGEVQERPGVARGQSAPSPRQPTFRPTRPAAELAAPVGQDRLEPERLPARGPDHPLPGDADRRVARLKRVGVAVAV